MDSVLRWLKNLPKAVNVVIALVSGMIGGFFLFFGVANLVHPDVPGAFLRENTIVCSAVILLGLSSLLLAVVAFWSMSHR